MSNITSIVVVGTLTGVAIGALWNFRNKKVHQKREGRHLVLVDNIDETNNGIGSLMSDEPKFLNNLKKVFKTLDAIPDDGILNITLQTDGGDASNCFRLLDCLNARKYGYRVFIHGVCASAGTVIALNAKEIVMKPARSYLGKIDPQIPLRHEYFAATQVLAASKTTAPTNLQEQVWLIRAHAAMNLFTDKLRLMSVGQKQLATIEEHFVHSEYPHGKLFDFDTCQALQLPVRLPTKEEEETFFVCT